LEHLHGNVDKLQLFENQIVFNFSGSFNIRNLSCYYMQSWAKKTKFSYLCIWPKNRVRNMLPRIKSQVINSHFCFEEGESLRHQQIIDIQEDNLSAHIWREMPNSIGAILDLIHNPLPSICSCTHSRNKFPSTRKFIG